MDPYVYGEATLWDEECAFHEVPPIVPCSSETGLSMWSECHRGLDYYVARHVDIHGNYGPDSAILVPQYPTGVDDLPVPLEFAVAQNVPNPFNPSTTIEFALPADAQVTVDIYGVDGTRVRSLVNEFLTAGPHSTVWNGRDDRGRTAASDVYFYKVTAGTHTATHRMMLLK